MTTSSASSRAPIGPGALWRAFRLNRDLIWQMTKREVVGRYKGSVLGLFWSFFHPILMLGVYTFAFSYVFNVRFPEGTAEGAMSERAQHMAFAFNVFAGMLLFTLVAEVLSRSPSIILQNVNYVKKVVFPLEIFPFVLSGAGVIHMAISLVVLVGAYGVFHFTVHATVLLLPVILAPLLLMLLGASWFLASLGVYLRDVSQTIGILTMMLMYLSPVFYSLQMIKNPYLITAIYLNPMTVPIENARRVLLQGAMPDFFSLGIYALISLAVCWLGFAWFQRTKRGFPDVL